MPRLRTAAALAAVFLAFTPLHLAAIQLDPVVTTGLSSPVFVGHAGDGSNRLFILERGGVVKVLLPGSSTPTVFLDIQTKLVAGGEQGLLGLAFHPQYAANGRFFVYYTRAGDGTLVIAEYQTSSTDPNVAALTESVLLTIPHPTNTNHNGGMLAFGPDGYLYIGVGDGGSGNDPPNNGQSINVLLGKILRIDVDHPDPVAGTLYSSPADNPFVGPAGRHEIYAFGFRNPWRFSFDRVTGQQWVGDVGQGAREEVDTPIVKGGNYGWRVFEGFLCTNLGPAPCDPANYIFPIFDYAHASGRCSITGGYVYRGSQGVLPVGTYVYGDYCSGEIFAWNGSTQSILVDTAMNISSFGEDEAGELYVVNLGGTVSKISSAAPRTYKTFTVPPCRVLDTRLSNPLGPILATGTRSILVAGDLTGGGTVNQGGAANCGVPDTATGVFVNVVAVNAGGPGHLTLYPFNISLPLASTLNFTTGQTIANGLLVPTCTPAGSCAFDLNITMGPAAAHVVIDVAGYLMPTL